MKQSTGKIMQEIANAGFITEKQMQLLKNRSNREQKDLLNYSFIESVGDGYGIPVTAEQGAKGLAWLKKFIKKNGESAERGGRCVYGWREIEIINSATVNDFTFIGFYDAGNAWDKNYLPIYNLNGMEYIPMATPYIIG